jgi:hypothetical protein
VFTSVVPAVKTAPLQPPQYAAALPYDDEYHSAGTVVRQGDREYRDHGGQAVLWLDDGRVLISKARPYPSCDRDDPDQTCSFLAPFVLDPADGTTTPVPGIKKLSFDELPGDALHRVTLTSSVPTFDAPVDRPVMYGPAMTSPEVLRLPKYDGKARNMSRSTGGRVYSIGDWDYTAYSDTDGEDETESYGYLRRKVGSSHWEKVLVNQRLVAIWVSQDGRALLGLQQDKGEPCGGCSKAQQIVEINPDTAEIVGSYGVPASYRKSWRVGQVDKMGSKVLVRFVRRSDVVKNLGVWQYDGSWSLVPRTNGLFTWWQGPQDRIEAEADTNVANLDGYHYRLYWVHGATRKLLFGQVLKDYIEGYRGVPGSLVPPS